jgi:hypothetical protein
LWRLLYCAVDIFIGQSGWYFLPAPDGRLPLQDLRPIGSPGLLFRPATIT